MQMKIFFLELYIEDFILVLNKCYWVVLYELSLEILLL